MTTFLEKYQSHFIYTMIIIGVVALLYLLTNILHKWLLKKEIEKFPNAPVRPINLIKHVLNVLWFVLGVIALSFLFVDNEKDADLKKYFTLASYLGVLSVRTIVAATACNVWFKNKIQEKTKNHHDPTSYKFLRYIAVFFICFIGVLFGLLAFPSLRGVAQTALGGAGILALIAGVSSQEALSNLVSGFFIISFKLIPFII